MKTDQSAILSTYHHKSHDVTNNCYCFSPKTPYSAKKYSLKVCNRNAKKRCEICEKLTVETALFYCLLLTCLTLCSSVFQVYYEHPFVYCHALLLTISF